MATVLEEKMRALAIARLVSEQAATIVSDKKLALQSLPEWQTYQEEVEKQKNADLLVIAADADVRQEMLNYYQNTGDKKPFPSGIEVKQYKHLTYDSATMLAWCEEHAPAMVEHKLAKKFDSIAEQLGAPVKVEYEPRVQIASDLRGFLPGDLLVASAEETNTQE